MTVMSKRLFIILLLVIASFVRLYRFADLTQFLGDQGRDGVIVSELFEQKKLPEVGSPLSTGQNTGPFHFYIVAPLFILSQFNPIAPALGLCVLEIAGVLLFTYLAIALFGSQVGLCISMLYGLSPMLVHQDRILWPPTPVPFFVIVVILSMYLVVERKKYWMLVPFFAANAALIQIHYANGIIAGISILFYAWLLFRLVHQRKSKKYVIWSIIGLVVNGVLIWPFLAYEIRNHFVDITSALKTFSSARGLPFSKRQYVQNLLTLTSTLSAYVVPVIWKPFSVILALGFCVGAIVRKNIWSSLFAGWLAFGIFVLAYYRDTLQPQYAYGLIPIIFLVAGSALTYLSKRISMPWLLGMTLCICILSLFQLDTFKPANRDIERVNSLTDAIIANAGGKPFSFTIISSPSYSDFHYRFFFHLKRIEPVPIDTTDYNTLFLVCESGQCPTVEEIHMNQKVYTMCYDRLCKLNYPIIDIWKWQFRQKIDIQSWVLYEYVR